MVTKIQKWGNSLALRIPKSFAAEAKVVAGSTVDISVANGRLVVRPTRRPQYVLRELLKGFNQRGQIVLNRSPDDIWFHGVVFVHDDISHSSGRTVG